MRKEAGELFERLGVKIDPDAMAGDLKTSQKQLLEIAKALFFHAKLLILDEPTTSLNNEEVAHFFEIIRRLKKDGASFIFISHKMPEIFALSDRYTVFRNGEYVNSGKIAETTPEEVTKMMVGESYSAEDVYEPREAGDTVLEVKEFSGAGFRKVNLSVKRGQIIGLTGLQGAGSSEFMQGLFGAARGTSCVRQKHSEEFHPQSHEVKSGHACLKPEGEFRSGGYVPSGKHVSGGAHAFRAEISYS